MNKDMLTNHPGNRKLIRAINRSNVLNCVKSYGQVSRNEIAKITGLSRATISGITAELIKKDLIFEKEVGVSQGGRKPILLSLNPKGGYVIGFKLTENHITGVITDLQAKVIVNDTFSCPEHSVEAILPVFDIGVKALLKKSKVQKKQLLGVGVGLAGIVDFEKGILRNSPILGWKNIPLRELLETQIGVPVTIDNDVNTLTLIEQWYGLGLGVENFLTVTIGRGVGLGMVINGQLYRGAHGSSGEFGHTVIDPNGPKCDCGNRGCLEAFIADAGLLREARKILDDKELTIEKLLFKAKQGDERALNVYRYQGNILARGIAYLINVLNPNLIIISGEGMRAGDFIYGPLIESLGDYIMPGLATDTEIKIEDKWDDNAWATGAAGLVLGELFESPLNKEVVI
jgi:predicted NBD/HSP70 family sugar kinase